MDETFATRDRHRRRAKLRGMSSGGSWSREEEMSFASFIASMPPDYRSAFDLEASRAHEAIVRRRGNHKMHVEIWRELSERVVAICVVGDDKPGLLSCISSALVASQIDVVSAHAYCRTHEDGTIEAVDFLWIRRLRASSGTIPPIRAKDILALADAIKRATEDSAPSLGLAAGTPIASGTIRTASPALANLTTKPANQAAAVVRFERDKHGQTVLTVEAVDRPGLLLAVTQALFRAGLQIVALRATTERGCAVDRFTLAEVDGSPLQQPRLLTLQTAILSALDTATLAPIRQSTG